MAAAAATQPMIQTLTREEAEEALRLRPMQPILRTCSYTPTFPRIHAITYRNVDEGSGDVRIFHSLMELRPNGSVEEITVNSGGAIERTGRTYESIEHLMQIVQRHQRRLLLHTRSLPAATVAVAAAEEMTG